MTKPKKKKTPQTSKAYHPHLAQMPSRDSLSFPTSDVDHPHLIDHKPSLVYEPSIITVPNSSSYKNKQTQTSSDEGQCPIHPRDYTIPTFPNPPLTLQQKALPNLPTLLPLRDLLCDQSLHFPMVTHCELHSPILDLYKSYCFVMGLDNHPMFERIRIPTKSGLVHTLTFMKTLKDTPWKHGRRTFCTQCYHLGHIKRDCRYYQYQPYHNEDQCLENPQLFDKEGIIIKQESQSPPPTSSSTTPNHLKPSLPS